VGFTRGFASSQAFLDKFRANADVNKLGAKIIPGGGTSGLSFPKVAPGAITKGDIYQWMGFEAYDLVFGFLDDAVADETISLDVFAYDLNEPDILSRLEALKSRLRIIIDDSGKKVKGKVTSGHGAPTSDESKAAKRLGASAGAANVKRTHFKNLQHHKVLVARRNGVPFKVLCGSTNFSFRGLYIQANNMLVFDSPGVADLYGQVFDAAFADPSKFSSNALAGKWHLVSTPG
jgi:hypothetical protein